MTLLLAIAIVVMAGALLYLMFPDEAWYLEDKDDYVVTSLFSYRKDRE